MNWQTLLRAGRIKPHQTSKQELDDLRAVIARDLANAAIEELSDDRRFATAYNAALQAARMAVAGDDSFPTGLRIGAVEWKKVGLDLMLSGLVQY